MTFPFISTHVTVLKNMGTIPGLRKVHSIYLYVKLLYAKSSNLVVAYTKNSDRKDIAKILLKVELNNYKHNPLLIRVHICR
jgi:hypothetical protein